MEFSASAFAGDTHDPHGFLHQHHQQTFLGAAATLCSGVPPSGPDAGLTPADMFRASGPVATSTTLASEPLMYMDTETIAWQDQSYVNPHTSSENSGLDLDAMHLPDVMEGTALGRLPLGYQEHAASTWQANMEAIQDLLGDTVSSQHHPGLEVPLVQPGSAVVQQQYFDMSPTPVIAAWASGTPVSPGSGNHMQLAQPASPSFQPRPASNILVASPHSRPARSPSEPESLAGRERFPLEIPRHAHSPLRSPQATQQQVTQAQYHLTRQRSALSIMTGTGMAPPQIVSPSVVSPYHMYSPGIHPDAQWQQIQQHKELAHQQQRSQSQSQLQHQPQQQAAFPSVGASPSLRPFQYPSPDSVPGALVGSSSLKSPRLLPSRKQRGSGQAPTGRVANVATPPVRKASYPPTTSVTPPYSEMTPTVNATKASSTAGSPQSPPPTPTLYAKTSQPEDEQRMDVPRTEVETSPTPTPTQDGQEDGNEEDDGVDAEDGAVDAGGNRVPRTPHKVSEKRRRELLKTHFDHLVSLLPPPPIVVSVESTPLPTSGRRRKSATASGASGSAKKGPNRIDVLEQTKAYLVDMETHQAGMRAEIDRLRASLGKISL
ncbi:hypothetical protein HKX48_002549 [Thoreauomyces humboldtii]|nr:hypothetical protein HKX48_002549 [Thoreauomyces humboldtii]